MKFKKLVSAVSALALSVTAFAGLIGTAEAATTAFTQDFTANEAGSTDPADYGFTKVSETEGIIDPNSKIVTGGGDPNTPRSSTSVSNGVLTNTVGGHNSTSAAEYYATFTPISSGNEVSVSYTWHYGSATGNNSNNSETYLADENGNKLISIAFYGNGNPSLRINGTSVKPLGTSDRAQTIDVSMTLDMNEKKVMTLSLGDYYTAPAPIDFQNSVTSVARFGFSHSARVLNWQNTTTIDNINITYEEARELITSAQVQYKTSNDDVIETISLDNVYDNNYAQKSVDGIYIGDQYYVPFQKYIFKDGVLYETAHTDANPRYGILTTFTENTVLERTVSIVTPAEGTEFIAVVDCDGDTDNSGSIRGSNMSAARGDITLAENVNPGIYSITYNQYIRGGNPKLYLNDDYVCDLDTNTGSWGEATTENITISGTGTLTIKDIDMTDYILLSKTGDYNPSINVLSNAFWTAIPDNSEIVAESISDSADIIELAGKEVYTMWLKTPNDEKPTITLKKDGNVLNGASNVAITMAEVSSSEENTGYFCVQILKDGLEAGKYTATFTLANGTAHDVTFTVAE